MWKYFRSDLSETKRSSELMYCGKCGTEIKEDDDYCVKCGNKAVKKKNKLNNLDKLNNLSIIGLIFINQQKNLQRKNHKRKL